MVVISKPIKVSANPVIVLMNIPNLKKICQTQVFNLVKNQKVNKIGKSNKTKYLIIIKKNVKTIMQKLLCI